MTALMFTSLKTNSQLQDYHPWLYHHHQVYLPLMMHLNHQYYSQAKISLLTITSQKLPRTKISLLTIINQKLQRTTPTCLLNLQLRTPINHLSLLHLVHTNLHSQNHPIKPIQHRLHQERILYLKDPQ